MLFSRSFTRLTGKSIHDFLAESSSRIPPPLRLRHLSSSNHHNSSNREGPSSSSTTPGERRLTPAMTDDGKPSKEFIEFFTKLASEVKKTDITARQQVLNSPKTQDFRALVAKRKLDTAKGVRYTSDELKDLFKDMKEGKFPDRDTEKMKRIAQKYELIEE